LVKASRGSKGRREAGEEKNYENNLLSSPASPAYPNRIRIRRVPLPRKEKSFHYYSPSLVGNGLGVRSERNLHTA